MDSDEVRRQLAAQLFERVAGPDSARQQREIHETPGRRWFDAQSPIQRVHGDASMFIGGIRALLLQSLHPLAMAGVAGHSGFRGDPWGRLQRTSYFVAVTTFGTIDHAEATIARVRTVHERVRGTAADGRTYFANDPHLLKWVHIAEIDSFLRAFQTYGDDPLDPDDRDRYVADTAIVAEALGIEDPPRTEAELATCLESYRPEMKGTPEARSTARYLLFSGPVPFAARAPYALMGSAAVELLDPEVRTMLGLPTRCLPGASTLAQVGGGVVTSTIRWAINAPPAPVS